MPRTRFGDFILDGDAGELTRHGERVTLMPTEHRQALPILALQIGAALAAIAPVFLLHW